MPSTVRELADVTAALRVRTAESSEQGTYKVIIQF